MTKLRSAIERTVGKIGVAVFAAALLVFPPANAGAQSAHAANGFSTQTLASITAGESGGQLVVLRIVLEPGITLPEHHHPGAASFTVVSGNPANHAHSRRGRRQSEWYRAGGGDWGDDESRRWAVDFVLP